MPFTVDPMPRMRWQVLKPGLPLGVVDLNCGWYCLRAVYQHWRERGGGVFHHSRIPKDRWARRWQLGTGFDPSSVDHVTEEDVGDRRRDIDEWEALLTAYGPIIACGKLGAADWGGVRVAGTKLEFGVGHYILIVGTATRNGHHYLRYKDPLQGERVLPHELLRGERILEDELDHMDKRINYIAYVTHPNSADFLAQFDP